VIEENMGSHIDIRHKPKAKHTTEEVGSRKRRASFKSYLRQLEEDLLEEEMLGEDVPPESEQEEQQ